MPVTRPTSNGAVTGDGGSFTYTPNLGFVVGDGFSYDLTDKNGVTATGWVSITVVPDVITPSNPSYSCDEDSFITDGLDPEATDSCGLAVSVADIGGISGSGSFPTGNAVAPDNHTIAVCPYDALDSGGTVCVYDGKTGKEISSCAAGAIKSVKFDVDSKTLKVVSGRVPNG
jgi:hypothetical protein